MSYYAHSNSTDCFGFENASDPARVHFYRQLNADLTLIYRRRHGWLQLPFAASGLLLASVYTLACFRAVRGRRVSRKSYVLLLNRSLGDVFTCLTALACACYVLVAERPK